MDAVALKKLLPPTADEGTATHLIRACATTGLPLSYGLALCEKEGAFRNVFGHDPTRSIPPGWRGTHVTWVKFAYYRTRRKLGLGMQGVGHTQLTWYEFQDQADKLGGCHKPYPQMVVGFRQLKQLIHQHGKQAGAAAYNGVGPDAEVYGRDFVRKQEAWHRRLEGSK